MTDQIFEKIIIENRRFQKIISSYAVFFQISFFSERRDFPKFFLIRRFLRLRSFRRLFLSVTLSFFSFFLSHSFFGSPTPRSQKNISQKSIRMKKISRNEMKFSMSVDSDMMNIEEEKKEIKMKKKK